MISLLRLMTVVVLCVLFSFQTGGDPNTKVVKHACTKRQYRDPGPYENRVFSVLNAVVAMTSKQGYSYLHEDSSSIVPAGKCYGHGACNGNISPDDCTYCLKAARTEIDVYCTTSVGALMKLEDCRIRYEDYPFDPNY